MSRPVALLLDVGGVLLLPQANVIAARLAQWGAVPSGHDDAAVHYRAVAAFDESGFMADYRRHYARLVGVREDLCAVAAESGAFSGPWRSVVPRAAEALQRLAVADLRMVVVSDSDGTVEQQLREARLAQIGQGPGVSLIGICDSSHVGVRKPHARMFESALMLARASPDEVVMVGDSLRCDIDGARACGIQPIHVAPLGNCVRCDHQHVAGINEVVDMLMGARGE
ncbi:HAD family hydrolase [Nocardia sp. bgisy118]|uniref:HAD family hydrolase n=1 Tax=Nocardia sp. bgisy118 TaxID=3413786 RepID=UPI003F49D8E5